MLARRGCIWRSTASSPSRTPRKRAAPPPVPDELLLVETDCPYLAPHPHRGKRNDSALMRLTIAALAEQRGQTPEYIKDHDGKRPAAASEDFEMKKRECVYLSGRPRAVYQPDQPLHQPLRFLHPQQRRRRTAPTPPLACA